MPPRPIELSRSDLVMAAQEVAVTEDKPSRRKLADRMGMVASTLNVILNREGWAEEVDAILHGLEPKQEGPVRSAANEATPAPWKAADVIRAHGDDPDEVVILRQRGNRWGPPEEPLHQLRVDWVRKDEMVRPADPGEWAAPPKPRRRKTKAPRKVVICGDHHAPHHDKTLHRLFCEWLEDEKPDEGVILGDLLDAATVSRHRERDAFAQPLNEGIQAAFGILMDYRHSSPDTKWTMLRGNHDDRIYHQIIDNTRGLHNIAAAGDEVPALSLRRLLHLDALNIELVDEEWDRGKTKITRRFTARHGYTSSKNSTEQMLTKLAHSTVQGHTHRLSLKYRTEHDDEDEDEPTSTRLAAEAGTMAEIHEGLGYTNDPDWTQGALLCFAYPDGDFHVSPLIYVPGRLLTPSGKRYAA